MIDSIGKFIFLAVFKLNLINHSSQLSHYSSQSFDSTAVQRIIIVISFDTRDYYCLSILAGGKFLETTRALSKPVKISALFIFTLRFVEISTANDLDTQCS